MQKDAAASSTAIDFKTQLAQERARAETKLTLKVWNSMNVFNALQDMRHIILLDFRDELEFNHSHIRKSIRVTLETYKDVLLDAMLNKDKTKQAQFKSQYDNDDLKRVVFIFPMPSYRKFEQHIAGELESINT